MTETYNRISGLFFELVSPEHRKHPETSITLPKRATAGSCAYDFYAPCDIDVPAFDKVMLWTDVKCKMPSNLMLAINVRSSMGKYGIKLANGQGWIDSDFHSNPSNDGNIGIFLENTTEFPFHIHKGDRVAQGMFLPYFVTQNDDVKDSRSGGFGSTT